MSPGPATTLLRSSHTDRHILDVTRANYNISRSDHTDRHILDVTRANYNTSKVRSHS